MACLPANAFLTDCKEERKEGSQLDLKPHSSESLALHMRVCCTSSPSNFPPSVHACVCVCVGARLVGAKCLLSTLVRQGAHLVRCPGAAPTPTQR